MDFSKGIGRVVADPEEALAAASEEACCWRVSSLLYYSLSSLLCILMYTHDC